MRKLYLLLALFLFGSAAGQSKDPFLVVLGTLQDGGSPHIGCQKSCCTSENPDRKVVSLGLVDDGSGKAWIVEATPDIESQLRLLKSFGKSQHPAGTDGIFLTHAHIGHYSGLMFLGKEALGAKNVTVFALPKMTEYLTKNGPWSQLVREQNILLKSLESEVYLNLSEKIRVRALQVPHRDEYSETAGFLIEGPSKKILFIPDIDKWEKWNQPIENWISRVDVALIDGTFFNSAEVGYRDISSIPHPLVEESMNRFSALPKQERAKIHFIHLNHTNPLLNPQSTEYKKLIESGFRVADIRMRFDL